MDRYTRYAVVYAPEAGSDLARVGQHWLGWSLDRAERVAHLNIDKLPGRLTELTREPRRYGFQCPLVAPFTLPADKSPLELHHAVQDAARHLAPMRMPGLYLSMAGDRVSLRPSGDVTGLGEAVRVIRRALSDFADTQWQQTMDFALPLTGPTDTETKTALVRRLRPILEPNLPRPFDVREISLCGEDERGYFRIVHRYVLGRVRTAMHRHDDPDPLIPARPPTVP